MGCPKTSGICLIDIKIKSERKRLNNFETRF